MAITLFVLLGGCVSNDEQFSHDAGPERPAEARGAPATTPVGVAVKVDAGPWWAPYERQCRAKGGTFEVTDSGLPVCHHLIDGGTH